MRRACANLIGCKHHRLQARAAHLVDGGRGHLLRHAGSECGLSPWRLADAGHQHATEDRFVDLLRTETAVLDGGLRWQQRRVEVRSTALSAPWNAPIGVRRAEAM